jgi:DNA-binding MarR family transcriptional regulator
MKPDTVRESSDTCDRRHILALMGVVQLIEAANQDRPTSQVDLRARIVIQFLGLNGPASILAVRQRLNVTPSTMTSVADRLERGGFIRRRPHPSDRRGMMLELTAKGRKAFDGEILFYQRLIDESLDPLGTEAKKQVLSALATLPGAARATDQAVNDAPRSAAAG